MPIEIAVIITLACLLTALLAILPARRRRRTAGRGRESKIRNCPLCGSALAAGEQVKSHRFRNPQGDEDLIHLLHCPHCRGGAAPRRCPVCHRDLPADAYLTGAMWREADKTRVHVLGCSRCSAPGERAPLRE